MDKVEGGAVNDNKAILVTYKDLTERKMLVKIKSSIANTKSADFG